MRVSFRSEVVASRCRCEGSDLVQNLFARQAAERPDAVAVSWQEQLLCYDELNRQANRLAHWLQQHGVGPESLVALSLERGPRMVVAMLAVLKAGGAYLPIDPESPRERIRFILEDAKPVVTLTEAKLADLLPGKYGPWLCLDEQADALAGQPGGNPPCAAAFDNAAYVIYTSGSTGRPKGVVVTHSNLARLFQATEPWFQFSAADIWTLFHSFAFDFSVWEMWGALLYGGRLVIVPHLLSRSPAQFLQLLVREKVTVLNQTPSAFRQLIWADQAAPERADLSLRWIVFGGESLELQSLKPWFDRHGDQRPRLVNMYGITETTVHVTYRPITRQDVDLGRGSVIGRPIPDLTLHIVDEHGQACGPGIAGEIWVGGAGVARGYLNRPELTAERFIECPRPESGSEALAGSKLSGSLEEREPAEPPGAVIRERCYRSGDLARRLPDGDIEYLGRADQQVKIHGFRIELGEIEAALRAHPAVRDCAVLARAEATGEKRLAGYLVCGVERPGIEEVRRFLQERIPDYMVPASLVFLEHLPLTVNGKVDRQALPAPAGVRPELSTAYVAPGTAEEKRLAAIWQSVLQLDRVGVHDNFFALGGDSIRSIQVLAQAQAQGLNLSLEQLFEKPTVFELVRCGRGSQEETISSGAVPFAGISEADRKKIPDGVEDAYPMARLQLGMVYHTQRDATSAIFHDVFSFRFQLPLDEQLLRQAAQRLAARHPIFRTSFDAGSYSEPLQLVHRDVQVPLSIEDLSGRDSAAQSQAVIDWIEAEKRRPFDWQSPPMMRLHGQRLGENSFQLIVSFHHIIMDGWSLAAMLTELFQDYTALRHNQAQTIPPPPVRYRDFIVLEQKTIHSESALSFWKRQLENPPLARLPRWPKSLRQGGREQVRSPEILVAPEILQGLKGAAEAAGVPFRTVLLAAHCRVMSWVTGQSDLVTGLVANGRPQVIGGERLLGLFLNTLPLRVPVKGGTWRELIAETFQAERELIPHRRFPLAELQSLAGGQPLFETVFDFVQFHVYRDLPGYGERTFTEDHYFEANNFAFYVTAMLDAAGAQLQIHFDYDPNELCPEQIEHLCGYYTQALEAIAHSPDAPASAEALLPRAEYERLAVAWNRTQRAFPEACVHELIESQATRTPQAVAACYEGTALTYAQLMEKVSALARALQSRGVKEGARVGIQVPRSLEMLLALLATMKAGGSYVPLDPSYPQERLEFMREDAQLALVLTNGSRPANAPDGKQTILAVDALLSEGASNRAPAQPAIPVGLEDVAYVIYTSGSTGKPKGVQIPHRALTNFLVSMSREPGLSSSDRWLAVTTLSFDIAALELLLPLTVGAQVVIAPTAAMTDPQALASLIEQHGITTLQATPTTWRLLLDSGWAGNERLKALSGGEVLPRDLADRLLARCAEVWNLYGPTETTIWSCLHKVEKGEGPVPIGRPIANTEVYLLDAQLAMVPTGSAGELYIGGTGVALGYLHRPELTAERFVVHPFKTVRKERLYRTGDLGRYLPDGTLVCEGRTDHQVKIRGVRIELGEIESTLAHHPAVAAAVVTARPDGQGGQQLIAYYVARPNATVSSTELRTFLETKLPPQMVPGGWSELAEFPLTPNGKVDRQRLPECAVEELAPRRPFIAPQTPLEIRLAAIWEEVLKVKAVGRHDDFFDLGGHSLLAIQAVARIRQELQIEMNLALLFEQPRLSDFAVQVLKALLEREENSTPSLQGITAGTGADGPGALTACASLEEA